MMHNRKQAVPPRRSTVFHGLVALAVVASVPAIAADDACASRHVYVTNEGDGTLSIIDAATHKSEGAIQLGKRPRGLVLAPDGRYLYVALSGSPTAGPGVDESTLPAPDRSADGIGVVDLQAGKVVRTLRGVSDPEQLALSPDGKALYVASEDSGKLAVFDVASGRVLDQFGVGGEPEGVGVSPDGRTICVTSEEAGTVTLVDAANHSARRSVAVGRRPRNCRFTVDGRFALVPSEVDATLSLVDVASAKVARRATLAGEGVRPMGVVFSPDGRRAYVSTGHGGSVVAVDADQLRRTGETKVGSRPWGIALSCDGRWLFSADGPSDTVSVVDTRDMHKVDTVNVGNKPWGVTVGP